MDRKTESIIMGMISDCGLSVDYDESSGWIDLTDEEGGSVFFQGETAYDLLDEATTMYENAHDMTMDDCVLAVVYPWADCMIYD